MFFATLSNILGAVILIATVLPWFLIAVGSISIAYLWAAMFYRASARELKVFAPDLPTYCSGIDILPAIQRLDAILRSSLYSHFSESLSGLATIRAYGESRRFLEDNQKRTDIENRSVLILLSLQR